MERAIICLQFSCLFKRVNFEVLIVHVFLCFLYTTVTRRTQTSVLLFSVNFTVDTNTVNDKHELKIFQIIGATSPSSNYIQQTATNVSFHESRTGKIMTNVSLTDTNDLFLVVLRFRRCFPARGDFLFLRAAR